MLSKVNSESSAGNFRKLHVLVVESDFINRTLIVQNLEKLGHSATNASDERQLLQHFPSDVFDLILIDVQLPEVGGLKAARAIRELEKVSGGHIPIFAMAAPADEDERNLYLNSGLDDYITEPFRVDDIEKALAALARQPAPPRSAGQDWNPDRALERLGGDHDLLLEICQIFLQESPRLVAELNRAVEEGNADAVQAAAHSIKGEVGYLGAENIRAAAKRLELMALDHDLTDARAVAEELDAEMARLFTAVRSKMGIPI